MLILFDNGTPRTLARDLIDHHAVTEARARGWEELESGELLTVAEAARFEVLRSRTRCRVSWRSWSFGLRMRGSWKQRFAGTLRIGNRHKTTPQDRG